MRLKRLPLRHAARASRSGAVARGGRGEGAWGSSPVPAARVLFGFFFSTRSARGARTRTKTTSE
jgi:hypothetical protein